jgi:hypothetical protein
VAYLEKLVAGGVRKNGNHSRRQTQMNHDQNLFRLEEARKELLSDNADGDEVDDDIDDKDTPMPSPIDGNLQQDSDIEEPDGDVSEDETSN